MWWEGEGHVRGRDAAGVMGAGCSREKGRMTCGGRSVCGCGTCSSVYGAHEGYRQGSVNGLVLPMFAYWTSDDP